MEQLQSFWDLQVHQEDGPELHARADLQALGRLFQDGEGGREGPQEEQRLHAPSLTLLSAASRV